MANPLLTPSAYDKITLDKAPSPGFVKRTSGGDRPYKIDQAQAPGFMGAYTLFRYEELANIEYRFFVWYDPGKGVKGFVAEYAKLEAFLAQLNRGNKSRPPKAYVFQDLYLSHNAINSIVAQSIGPIEKDHEKLLWSAAVRFAEYKRLNLFGGAPKPPQNEQEKRLQEAQQGLDNAAFELKQKQALKAKLRNGEGL